MTEFFMQHFWLLWLIVAIVCLSLEMTSGDFFLTCFAIGAMVSVLAAAFDTGDCLCPCLRDVHSSVAPTSSCLVA